MTGMIMEVLVMVVSEVVRVMEVMMETVVIVICIIVAWAKL